MKGLFFFFEQTDYLDRRILIRRIHKQPQQFSPPRRGSVSLHARSSSDLLLVQGHA